MQIKFLEIQIEFVRNDIFLIIRHVWTINQNKMAYMRVHVV